MLMMLGRLFLNKKPHVLLLLKWVLHAAAANDDDDMYRRF